MGKIKELFQLEQEAAITESREQVRIMEMEAEWEESQNQQAGELIGEVCGRKGCQGILQSGTEDTSCSCHISPPCGHCCTVSCTQCDFIERA